MKCKDCGNEIPAQRLAVMAIAGGTELCIGCRKASDKAKKEAKPN